MPMLTISLSFYFLLYQMIIDDGRFYWWKCISLMFRLIEFPCILYLPFFSLSRSRIRIWFQLSLKIHLHHHSLLHCWYQSSSACRSNQFIPKIFFPLSILAIVCHTSKEPNLPNYQSNYWWYWKVDRSE